MATISEWIKHLKLRNKLALIYTTAFTLMLCVTFLVIYSISEENRREEFYKRLSDRTISTFKISIQVDQINNDMLRLFDNNTINSLSDEKILLFNAAGTLIYSNVDSEDISYATPVLAKLKGEDKVLEISGDKYELLGQRFEDKGQTYYGIAKAYDLFGISKMHFLAVLLTGTFVIVSVLIVALSFVLSGIVTRPITRLTGNIDKISPDNLSVRLQLPSANDEIGFLARKFNELLDKVENAFEFQYHYIHHLSHELKTPLAVMMANAERAIAEDEPERLRESMQFQKNAIMELSHIINVLLDISKTERKLSLLHAEQIRIDEVLFECMDEICLLNPAVRFGFKISDTPHDINLVVPGNSRMVKMVVMNLLKNAVNFSGREQPQITIAATAHMVQVSIENDGAVLDEEEQAKLFNHSFRGSNSSAIKGFGLGLVLAGRMVSLHKGTLAYSITAAGRNLFLLSLPAVS